MALLEHFRKKAKDEPTELAMEEELPEELEKFRVRARDNKEPFLPEEYKRNIEAGEPKKENVTESKEHVVTEHKIDLILSKLETIDARLKLLEEKLKRFG